MPLLLIKTRHLIITSALSLMVLIIGGFAYIYLPSATITISPATSDQTATQIITLSTATTEPDFEKLTLPAQFIDEEVVEEKTITRSGANISEDFARGIVTLTNDQDDEQPLLPKTHLRHESSGVFFLTDNAVRLPPRGTLDVPVTAKEKGGSGNAPPGKFIVDKLPASMQAVVFGTSQTSFTGGQVIDSPLTKDDLAKARQQIKQQAVSSVTSKVTANAGGAAINPNLIQIDIEDERTTADTGSQATDFTVSARARARAFIVDANDLLSLTLLKLRSAPASDEEFVAYNPDSFELKILQSDYARGEARFETKLTGSFARKTESTLFNPTDIIGLTAAEVQEHFLGFDSIAHVDVRLQPAWISTVPSRSGATEIVFKQP